MPTPSFNQMVTGPNGQTKSTSNSKNGRPTLGQNPNQKRSNDACYAGIQPDELEILASADTFEQAIDARFNMLPRTKTQSVFRCGSRVSWMQRCSRRIKMGIGIGAGVRKWMADSSMQLRRASCSKWNAPTIWTRFGVGGDRRQGAEFAGSSIVVCGGGALHVHAWRPASDERPRRNRVGEGAPS